MRRFTLSLAVGLLAALGLGVNTGAQTKATLQSNDATFEYTDPTHALYTRTYTVVIPDKSAERFASFSCLVNSGSTKLKSFSGVIQEASGKARKLKKSDLGYTEYSQGLADSYGTYFFSPALVRYPVTITYSYEISYSDAILAFPPFVPQPFGSGIALESATYTLNAPSWDSFSFRALNMDGMEPERSESPKGISCKWTVKDLPAAVQEPYSPPLTSRSMAVLFTPSRFTYEGKEGEGKSWETLGRWLNSLSEGGNALPEELQDKVKSLTEGCATDFEKIYRIHEYLGQTTRYVSIQLGLGGLKPLSPSYVFKNKFGDCKALSFYMKSMLESCGIPSDYVIINMGTDTLIPDFPSLSTSNHAILSVPCGSDTLWVECTDPEVPLGYVHGNIAGNHALVVKKEGSFVTRIPKPEDAQNTDSLRVEVFLKADGSAEAKVVQRVRNLDWETFHALSKESSNKQADYIKNGMDFPMVRISDLRLEEFPSAQPEGEVSFAASASPYASQTGSRLFVRVNPFRNYSDNTSRTRHNDLYFGSGWMDIDEITLHLPDGYEIETRPQDCSLESKFGSIDFSMERPEGSGEITMRFSILHCSGTFKKDDYKEYRDFRKKVNELLESKIVLVKK